MDKKVFVVLGIAFVSVALCLLSLVLYSLQRVDANNDLLSKTNGKSIPRMHYESIISYNSSMRTIIPLLTSASAVLFIVGFYLALLPKVKVSVLVFAVLVLILIPTSFAMPTNEGSNDPAPTTTARMAAAGSDRWYAELTLQQPRDAAAIGGYVYVYDNGPISTYEYSFVAFRIVLLRVDTVFNQMEWLEAGYIQNRSGFWIYGASYILGKGYVENDCIKLAGEGSNGESYLPFTIAQSDSANTFRATMSDPMIGMWLLMEVTFTIGGDNLYLAGSESSDPANSLNGHYAGLWYCRGDVCYDWADVQPHFDPPYSVTLASTNEFYTAGGQPHDC